jgi:drug/metabolite transporter (DMT)-like permease
MQMVVFEWLLGGGAPPRRVLVGIALGMAGIVVLVGPSGIPGPSLAVLLFAAWLHCAATMVFRHAHIEGRPLVHTGFALLVGGLVVLPFGLLAGPVVWPDTPGPWLAFGYLLVAGTVVVRPVYTWLSTTVPASWLGSHAIVNPVVAMALGAWVLGEPFGLRQASAAALVVFGLGAVLLGEGRRAALSPPSRSRSRQQARAA